MGKMAKAPLFELVAGRVLAGKLAHFPTPRSSIVQTDVFSEET
jgi:hypothetical protein